MVTQLRLATLSVSVLCGCVALIVSGCFGPSPYQEGMQQLIAEKNQLGAECNQEIEGVGEFYVHQEDAIERETQPVASCSKKRLPWPVGCVEHWQKAIHAASELSGKQEINMSACATANHLDCPIDQAVDVIMAASDTGSCFKEKFGKPYSGLCPVDGLSRDCILAIDEGARCLPNAPELTACNRLVRIQSEGMALLAAHQESERTEAMRSQATAAWAQTFARQRANQQQYLINTPGQPPTLVRPFP